MKIKLYHILKNIGLVILFVLFFIFVIVCLKLVIVEKAASEAESNLSESYAYNEELSYYYDFNENEDLDAVLTATRNKLPNHLQKVINDWNILIAHMPPFNVDTAQAAAGITYLDKKVIWLSHVSNEKIIMHEFGHVISNYLGNAHNSKQFTELYNLYWNTYIEHGQEMIDIHSISCQSEFFASTFCDYILEPEYLKEKAIGLYDYYESITKPSWKFYFPGKLYGVMLYVRDTLKNFFNPFVPSKNLDTQIINTEETLIDITQYEFQTDYSWMNDVSMSVIDVMFDVLQNPDNYEFSEFNNSYGYVLTYDYEWKLLWYEELCSYTTIYFLDERLSLFDIYVEDGTTTLCINYDLLLAAEEKRMNSLYNVENILSTKIYEGSETDKLLQIAKWMHSNILYRNVNSTQHVFWHRKTGDCVSYAMIFKQFCDRLGIKCDIVYIQDAATNGRLYNMVTLKDGEAKFYDISEGIVNSNNIYHNGYYLNLYLPIADATKKHSNMITLYR